jgi:transposase
MSRNQTYEWYKRFKDGRTSIEDDKCSGRPSLLNDDQHIENVCEVITSNRPLTVLVVADEVGTSKTSCH